MTTVAVIVQARLGSTRLPAKTMLMLPTGRTVLGEVLHRCKQIKNADIVVCAVPKVPDSDVLLPTIAKAKVRLSYGPEHDVLTRYRHAAQQVNADFVLRITSDCPMLDPVVCATVIEAGKTVDYCSNCHPRTWAQGLDCELMALDALLQASEEATTAYDREHCTPYIVRNPQFSKRNVANIFKDESHIRLTLDTLEDYVTIYRAFEKEKAA